MPGKIGDRPRFSGQILCVHEERSGYSCAIHCLHPALLPGGLAFYWKTSAHTMKTFLHVGCGHMAHICGFTLRATLKGHPL